MGVIGQATLVKHLGVLLVNFERLVQIFGAFVVVLLVVEGGRSILKEFNIFVLFGKSTVIVLQGFFIVFQCVVTLTETVKNASDVMVERKRLVEIADGLLN